MLINVVFTVGTLLLCFLGTTSADDCYHGGYTFGDLLDDADLNSTIKPWCQSYDGKQYKNGETVRQIESVTRPGLTENIH